MDTPPTFISISVNPILAADSFSSDIDIFCSTTGFIIIAGGDVKLVVTLGFLGVLRGIDDGGGGADFLLVGDGVQRK
jgi:hypothetical protein